MVRTQSTALAELIVANVRYLQGCVERGGAFSYSVYKDNCDKTVTKEAIHHQILTIRNMLLELDKAISIAHNK